jgi:hypothetical protein
MQDTTQVLGKAWNFVSNNQVAAGLFVALVIAVVAALRRPLWRGVKWLGGGIAQLARRAANRLRRLRPGNTPAAVDLTPYIKESHDLRIELEQWKAEAVQARMNYRYGETLGTFEPLTEVRMVALVDHVAELLPTTGLLVRACEVVWRSLRPQYKIDSPRSAVRDVIEILEGREHYQFNSSATALEEQLQWRLDPRPYLLCFYRRYREWREAIHNVSNYLGTNIRYESHYAEWRLQDDKWRQELWQKLASPNLSQVRSRVTEYDHEHGALETMPVADTPYTGPTQSGPGVR